MLVTVRIDQTEITETGISSDTSTTNTHALIRLVRWRVGPRPRCHLRSGRARGSAASHALGIRVLHLDALQRMTQAR